MATTKGCFKARQGAMEVLGVVQDGKEVYGSKRVWRPRSRCLVEMWTLVIDECFGPTHQSSQSVELVVGGFYGRRASYAGLISMCILFISVLGRIR